MSFDAVHWSAGQIAFLVLVIAGMAAFVVTLMSTHLYVLAGDRAAHREAVVTPAVRPDQEDRPIAA
jgi:hypothetical protein